MSSSKPTPLEDVEVEHEFPRVGRRTLMVNASKLHRESGQESILLAFEDRTEARNTEREREALLGLEQQARQRAEQADQIKDEFVATLSHELRGPLNSMVGWVHVLRAGGLDEATRELGRAAIERSVNAQTRLIEDLLDYSRVVAGKLHLAPRLMDVVPVAGSAIETVRAAADAKGIRLELATDAKSAMVHGDPDRLQQILWNLLSNAVKFTAAGRAGRGLDRASRRVRAHPGEGHRTGHLAGLPSARVRALPPTGRHATAHAGRARAGPGHRQGARGASRGHGPRGERRRGPGSDLRGGASPRNVARRSQGPRSRCATGIGAGDGPDAERPAIAPGGAAAGRGGRRRQPENAGDGLRAGRSNGERGGVGRGGDGGPAASGCGRPRLRRRPAGRGWPRVHPERQSPSKRKKGGRIPALALTAYAGPADGGKALAAGFDGHVSKPALPAELVAQVARLAGPRGGS